LHLTPVPDAGDQRQLLPHADRSRRGGVAGADAGRLRVRLEGLALPDPQQEAQGSARTIDLHVRAGAGAGAEAGADPVPAARHPGWYADDVLEMLRRRNVALCISDHHHAPAPWAATADFIYLRGHGPGGRYHGRYGEAALRGWAKTIRKWRKEREVFVYFDND